MSSKENNILVAGCSFTKGFGFDLEDKDPDLWVNKLFDGMGYVNNIATTGLNNESIFHAVSAELLQKDYDIVLVCWSAIPRYNFDIGLECYYTKTIPGSHTINIHPGKVFTKQKLKKIHDQLLELHNDHWDILKMVQYVNILISLQVKLKNKKIYFVNGIGPWSNDFFTRQKDWDYPNEIDDLDDYTKFLLFVETRDDDEIKILYNKIHDGYQFAGGIQESYWLNLYDSLDNLKVDTAPLSNYHPGYKSQEIFVNKFKKQLMENEDGTS